MAALGAVGAGLQAAMLLARGRPEGLRYVEPGLAGARRSFWAVLVCLPLFAGLRFAGWTASASPAHACASDLFGYVIGWVGFAALSHSLVAMLGRERAWPRYIAAWNWCNVAQYVLLLIAAVPALFGAAAWLQQSAGLVAVGWAVWLEWYAARLTLGVGPLTAALLTGIDLLLGVVLGNLAATWSGS